MFANTEPSNRVSKFDGVGDYIFAKAISTHEIHEILSLKNYP